MVRYIIGGTGRGKSTYCYKDILKRAYNNPDKQYIILVPEQFTLETQRALVKESKNGVILNVDVLSFMRLAHRIFDELIIKEKLVLEDTGKNMVIRRLLSEYKDKLSFFKNVRGNKGFNSDLKSFISELMQYRITPDKLLKAADNCTSDILSAKLQDTAFIYEKFIEYKKDKYIAAEQVLELLANELVNSKFVENSTIYFDGFTGFTPIQLRVIDVLLSKAEELIFNITISAEEYFSNNSIENFNIFHLSRETIQKVNEIAIKKGVSISTKPVILNYNEKNEELDLLEKNIFRYSRKKIPTSNSVIIKQCKNKKDEIQYLLLQILSFVRDEGKRYRDIAVVVGDMAEYGESVAYEFTKAGIPCFLDSKKPITANPFIEYIRSSLLVIEENFSIESVMRYLRSGFSGIDTGKTDVFENFILRRGIEEVKRYQRCFEENSGRKEYLHECEVAEEVRIALMQEFTPLYNNLKSKKGKVGKIVLSLYNFIRNAGIEKKLSDLSEEFEKNGLPVKSKEYSQCFKIVMSVFEKMYELLGDKEVTLDDFREILESGFDEGEAGFIPLGSDQVVIGDVERTRLENIKILFCTGFNEGLVPKPSEPRGFITDFEKDMLQKFDIELSPTAKEKAFREQFYIYMLFSKPTYKLYVTYSEMSSEGRTAKPSYFVNRLKSLFENYKSEKHDLKLLDEIRKDGGMDFLLKSLKNEKLDDNVLSIIKYYEMHEDKRYLNLINGFNSKAHVDKLRKDIAEKLYENLKGSVTRLELFAVCPYAHFIKHGLRLEERKEFELRPMDIGNILHEVLEKFVKKVINAGSDFSNLSETGVKSICDSSLNEILNLREEINSSNRLKYQAERLKRISNRAISTIVKQISGGSYLPIAIEEEFVNKGFKGRIDRIDSATLDYTADMKKFITADDFENYKKVEFVRVIDYKSGKKEFNLDRAFYGLDLQLFTYLDYVRKELKNTAGHEKTLIVPAGAYYFYIDDPVIDFGAGEDAFLKALRLEGITLDQKIGLTDRNVIDGVALKASTESNIIKLKTKKDAELSSSTKLYTLEEVNAFIDNSEMEIERFKDEISSGEITPAPYSLAKDTGCTYCKYREICGFDLKIPGYNYNRLKPINEKEFFDKIREKVGRDVRKD